jgi:hypothetical protein
MKVLQHISRQIPLYAHPGAFLKRWLFLPDDLRVSSMLNEEDLKKHGAVVTRVLELLPFQIRITQGC